MSQEQLVPIPVARKECLYGSSPSLENVLELYDFFRHQVLITAKKIAKKSEEIKGDIPNSQKQTLNMQLKFLKFYVKKKAKIMHQCHRSVNDIYLSESDKPFKLFQDLTTS